VTVQLDDELTEPQRGLGRDPHRHTRCPPSTEDSKPAAPRPVALARAWSSACALKYSAGDELIV
jgi:hypothetical protein